MKLLKIFMFAALFITALFVALYMANSEVNKNPKIEKAVMDIDGKFVIGIDTVEINRGKIKGDE